MSKLLLIGYLDFQLFCNSFKDRCCVHEISPIEELAKIRSLHSLNVTDVRC